jgi:hypothetical protein
VFKQRAGETRIGASSEPNKFSSASRFITISS